MYNQMPNSYLGYGQYGQPQYRAEMQQYNQMPAQPQLMADFIATYGEEIISITNYLFKKLSERL